MDKVSILVPVFNEQNTIINVLDNLKSHNFLNINLQKEIIILLDVRSNDGTKGKIENFLKKNDNFAKLFMISKPGKGYAIKYGFEKATGKFILIQDADLEYDINDYEKLLSPLYKNETNFVLGIRFNKGDDSPWKMRKIKNEELYGFFLNLGGIIINAIMNILYNVKIKDQATMYKVFNIKILEGIKLESNHFETEVELLCKLFKKKIYPLQIPINYKARSKAEGKKINFFRDGISFLKVLLKYRFFN
tara:strand:- start:637 stop:1380 length:744 start_codon:yes stop_codon:yes gene_type:complete